MITSVTNVTAARLGATKNTVAFKGSFIGFDEVMIKQFPPTAPKKGFFTRLKEFFVKPKAPKTPSIDDFIARPKLVIRPEFTAPPVQKPLKNAHKDPALHQRNVREQASFVDDETDDILPIQSIIDDGPVFRSELQDDATKLSSDCDGIEDRSNDIFGGNDGSCSDSTSFGGDD